MQRRQTFAPNKEPFRDNDHIQLTDTPNGPFSFFNPTGAHFGLAENGLQQLLTEHSRAQLPGAVGDSAPGVKFRWTSRNNRKGRHTLVVDPDTTKHPDNFTLPPATNSPGEVTKGIKRMFTEFPVWDVSYLVAQFFTWGSLIFTISGLFYWLPVAYPSTAFASESDVAAGLAFAGCVFFQIGVVLLMLEVINENRTGCFGWALERAMTHDSDEEQAHVASGAAGSSSSGQLKMVPKKEACVHHHQNKGNIVGKAHPASRQAAAAAAKGRKVSAGKNGAATADSWEDDAASSASSGPTRGWQWAPTWDELKNHYLHDMGFLANFIMFSAATIFWIVGFAGLPQLYAALSPDAVYGVFWTPDIVGSVGFVVASWLLMVETQKNWYTPAWDSLGWHINLWNVIGSVGFLLSAVFGVFSGSSSKALYQSDLSTTWGSFAFLVGSVLLWYEALDKHPVEYKKSS